VRGKTIVLVAMLVFLIYGSSIVYVEATCRTAAYGYYDIRYDPVIGGVQIEVTDSWGGIPAPSARACCSLAFPVKIKGYNPPLDRGFITAGHCIEADDGGDFVDQPKKGGWGWENFLGRGIRSSFPHGGGITNLDAALIHFANYYRGVPYPSSRDFKPFIFENNSTPYHIGFPDSNSQVGIIGYLRPEKSWENKTIAYKSGRKTGVTYGLIQKIDDRRWTFSEYGYRVDVKPLIKISRCYTDDRGNYKCYYRGNIAGRTDSGGPVYLRYLIYFDPYSKIYHYIAYVIGIVSGTSNDWPVTELLASWAVLVRERWPDLELVTCVQDYSYRTCL
jgi:hypothetical protein